MNGISVEGLGFSFKQRPLFQDLTFQVSQGEFVSILGKSGSGKTTLLRLCAGFETPACGKISIFGEEQKPGCQKKAGQVGFIFQDFALFEHLTVKENVEYGCDSPEDFNRCQKLVGLLGISDLLQRRPCDISGGERQRVALVRALALDPKLLFMDEPFSNVDRDQTRTFITEFREIFRSLGVTVIMVTHSLAEAIQFSDRIVFMSDGKILQDGSVKSFYNQPASSEVKAFFGQALWIQGEVKGNMFRWDGGTIPLKEPHAEGPTQLLVAAPDRHIFLSLGDESS